MLIGKVEYIMWCFMYRQVARNFTKSFVCVLALAFAFYLVFPVPATCADKTLELSHEEEAWLKEHKTIPLLVTYVDYPYSFVSANGELVGILADICSRIESMLGVDFKYEIVEYSEIVESIKNKDRPFISSFDTIDFPEYENDYYKTRDIVFMPYGLFSKIDSEISLEGMSGVHGKRVAIMKGWNESNPSLDILKPCEFVYGNTSYELINLLLNGEVDAIYDLAGSISYYLDRNSIKNIELVQVTNKGMSQSLLVKKDWQVFYNILTKALAAFTFEDIRDLQEKWLLKQASPRYRLLTMDLTHKERSWLASHPVIRVGSDPFWAPIESRSSEGTFSGLSIDYLRTIESYLGVKFEIDRDSSWQQIIEKAKTGEIDMITAVTYTQERGAFLDFTESYLISPIKMFAGAGAGYIGSLGELKGMKVSVVQGYATEDFLRKDHPEIELVLVPDIASGIKKIIKGDADIFVGNFIAVGYELSKMGNNAIKVVGDTEYSYDLGVGVRKDWPILRSIVQKAINEIPLNEKNDIYRRWIPLTVEARFDYIKLLYYFIPVVILIAIFIAWNWQLKVQVAKRTVELVVSSTRLEEAEKLALLGHWENLIDCDEMFWSAEVFGIFGIDKSSTTPTLELFCQQIHDDERDNFLRQYEVLRKSGVPFSGEFCLKDGSSKATHVSIQCRAGTEEEKNADKLLGTIQDISRYIGITEKLKKSEERYRLLSDLNTEGVVIHQDGVLLEINKGFCDIFGYSHDELINKYSFDIMFSKENEKIVREKVANGFEGIYEVPGIHKDGHEVFIEVQARNYIYNGKNTRCSIVRDITALKNTQAKLRQAEKMQAIGQLAGGVAHDFNNMLCGIIGSSELLVRHIAGNPDAIELNNVILSAAERAGELTNQLLAFSRKQPSVSIVIDIQHCLHDAIALLRRTFDKRIIIVESFSEERCEIIGDPSLLQSAFMNLGVNASHAMPNGGELRVSTSIVELDKAYCDSSAFKLKPGRFIEIEFLDNGVGIDAATISKIFEPFFTTKEQGQGTGLGLSAAYGTIQQHNGAISVYSEAGKGASFRILLPVREDLEAVQTSSSEQSINGSGCVLVVDDEDVMRFTAKAILNEHGYNVLTASNGQEAVSIFREKSDEIDIVLLDMIMPVMNGMDAFNEIRAIKPDVKVILASGFTKDADVEDMKALGLRSFIKKPYRVAILTQEVQNVMASD